mmetsp:Transcript_28689/g.67441  ORF Transcript_28689/g.67441 Transcript_28689/m.67441 type:complete len:346 (+) Transcript_28689:1266-2303(+)
MLLAPGAWVEIVRALPSVVEAELTALGLQHIVNITIRNRLHRPGSQQILVREVHMVVHAIGLSNLRGYPVLRGPRTIPRRVGLLQFVGRLPVCNPLRQVAAQACAVRNAVGLCTCQPKVGRHVPLRRGADKVVSISRPHRGPVQHGLHAYFPELRQDLHRPLQVWHQALHIALEEEIGVLVGHACLPPLRRGELHGLRVLVGTQQDPIAFVTHVEGALQVPEHWQLVAVLVVILLHFRDGLRDAVLMLQHHRRHADASHGTNFVAPEPGCIDHEVCYRPLFFTCSSACNDLPLLAGEQVEGHHLRFLLDDAAEAFSSVRKGVCDTAWVDVTIALCQNTSIDPAVV